MKKRLFSVLSLILVFTFVLTACTSGTKTPTTQDPNSTTKTETKYPERPIQNVIPFGAGGGTDVWNRAIMDAMGGILGQTIVSSNMTGGSSGSIGVDYVWKSKHDGYTLAGTSETPLTIPVMTGLKQTAKDWEIFIAAGSPGLLCLNAKSKYKSLDEVIAALKANPQSVSIAGTTGGLWFALAKLFEKYGNLPFKWVAYSGSGPAIKGAVSNETDCVVASAGEVKEFVKSKDLIPIAVMDKTDWEFPGFGKVPAVTTKVPDLAKYLPLQQFLGFMVPKDTDPAVVAKLQDTFKKAMATDAIKKFADEQLCVIFNKTGKDSADMAAGLESKLCWLLYDMGQTKFSPQEFGIPKP